jgi:hypothetical protein
MALGFVEVLVGVTLAGVMMGRNEIKEARNPSARKRVSGNIYVQTFIHNHVYKHPFVPCTFRFCIVL